MRSRRPLEDHQIDGLKVTDMKILAKNAMQFLLMKLLKSTSWWLAASFIYLLLALNSNQVHCSKCYFFDNKAVDKTIY